MRDRGTRRKSAPLMVGLVVVASAIAVDAGCVGDTGGRRFAFEAAIGGAADEPARFTNERGWTVSLAKANVTVGPIYLNVVAPLTDTSPTARFFGLFVKDAWAHGEGHLGSGRIVGEILSQVTFDARSGALVPFPTAGAITSERIRTADVWFYPAPGIAPETTKIAAVAFDVAGEATRGAEAPVRFRGALVLDDAWLSDTEGTRGALSLAELRKVRGIATDFAASEGGRLEIRFDVRRLFRGADFANLTNNPTDADGTKVLVQAKTGKVTTDQVMTNLYQGLREATGTYAVRWIDP